MAKPIKIFFRADGHAQMGLGHVIRSLALADMLREDFECSFMIRNPMPSLRQQILGVCKNIIELPETEDDLKEAGQIINTHLTGHETVVLDGYHFNTAYQTVIKEKGNKLVCIDDIYTCHFVADAVINHAPGLSPAQYSSEPYTQLCLGLDYSLLRKPFLEAARRSREINDIENIFICFGGSDFNNITLKVIKAISTSKSKIKKVDVVMGGANKFIEEVRQFIKKTGTLAIHIHENLSAQEMVGLMESCDMAIVPASSILYEVISVKMPVISGYYIDNQMSVYQGFKGLGLVYGVGDMNEYEDYSGLISKITEESPEDILALQERYQTGKSKENFLRLFNQLSEPCSSDNITCRKATIDDLMLYFNWANDPVVRKNAVSTKPIKIEEHQRWFSNKINSTETFMYIFEINNNPVGQVRFDVVDKSAIISYSADKSYRGKGIGKKMLQTGIQKLMMEQNRPAIDQITGIVKIDNIPSAKTFEKLGFEMEDKFKKEDKDYYFYSLKTG